MVVSSQEEERFHGYLIQDVDSRNLEKRNMEIERPYQQEEGREDPKLLNRKLVEVWRKWMISEEDTPHI